MNLNFDIRGHLKPYGKNDLNLEQFKDFFVDSFDQDSSRNNILENFINYNEDFQDQIGPNFFQWINGSFVTNKKNPGDIDLVTFIDYQIAIEKKEILEERFLNRNALKAFKIDAYIVRIYPEGHKMYRNYVSDSVYWEHWFGNSKKNRAKKRFPKGFIQLTFG